MDPDCEHGVREDECLWGCRGVRLPQPRPSHSSSGTAEKVRKVLVELLPQRLAHDERLGRLREQLGDPTLNQRTMYTAEVKLEEDGLAVIAPEPGQALVPAIDRPELAYRDKSVVAALFREELRFGEWPIGEGRDRWGEVARLSLPTAFIVGAFGVLNREEWIYYNRGNQHYYPGTSRAADPALLGKEAQSRANLEVQLNPTGQPLERRRVWERDGGRCHLCLEVTERGSWHLEHVIPLSARGTHEYANLAVSHPRCNLSKGARWPRSRDRSRLEQAMAAFERFHRKPYLGRVEHLP